MGESLKEKMERAITDGFERAQEDKVRELNRMSQTGKKISRRDYNTRNLAELYNELGLEYPAGVPLAEHRKN
jgi:hypothetical protein